MEGVAYLDSPVGELVIRSKGEAITTVNFLKEEKESISTTPVIEQCMMELEEYFNGSRKFFSIPLDLVGTTFQLQVWNRLIEIPYGKTITYTDLSLQVGNIKSIRAVGLANGQNPIAVIVPCHRVIGKDGSLVGYGGGLDKKEWLLKHEGALQHQFSLF